MTAPLPNGLKPLGMTCTSTDCSNGLHFFRPKPVRRRKRGGEATEGGSGTAGPKQLSMLEMPESTPRGPCRAS